MKRTLIRWVCAIAGLVLLVMWIMTTARSTDTMPWNNEWLVALVLLAIVAFVGLARYTLPLPRSAARKQSTGDPASIPPYPHGVLRSLITYFALFFGLTWLLMFPIASSEGKAGSVVVERDGRSVAVVAYDRYGPQGMLQVGLGKFFPQNVVAIDVETGKHLWVTEIAADNFPTARVVAANEEFAYVANAEGLRILDMKTGRTVAEPGSIAGLDETSVGAGRFIYDAARDRILAQTREGLVQIPVGALSATPASDEDGYQWSPLFGDEHHDLVANGATFDEAAAGDALLTVSGDQLLLQRPGEEQQVLTEFEGLSDNRIVANPNPPERATQQFRVIGKNVWMES